jgi:hypothetical protein
MLSCLESLDVIAAAERAAEKVELQTAAPEGAIDNSVLTLCLKA